MKNKRLHIRCDQSELDELERKIKLAKTSKSEYLRKMIFSSQVIEVDRDHQTRMLYLFANLSNNMNQVAKRANTKKHIDRQTLEELQQLRGQIAALFKATR